MSEGEDVEGTTVPDVEGTIVPDPEERDVTLREFNLFLNSFEHRAALDEATRKVQRRDRLIGWFIQAVLTCTVVWILFDQASSENELRENLYRQCLAANTERETQAQFYREVGERFAQPGGDFQKFILDMAKKVGTPRDCADRYLR